MTATTSLTLADLRTVDLFDDASDEQLAPWVGAADVRSVPVGERVVEAGQEGHGLHLLLHGRLRVSSVGDGRVEPEGVQIAPTWVGAIPSLTHGWHQVRMEAETDARIATIPRERFVELVLQTRPVFERLMQQMRPVIRRSTEREASRERLASLGTMAAGLAHELNNPAAAAKRASSDLAETLEVYEQMVARLVESGVEQADAAKVVACKNALQERAKETEPLSALERADAEDAIGDLLDELGVGEGWKWTEPLVAAGADEAWVRKVAGIAGESVDAVIRWVAASLQAHTLTDELSASTDRMSELVRAVKAYAFMDRGEVVNADVHKGIETTLMVMKHKIKHTSIEVVRRYDKTLPRVEMRGSELNQVWTNLIHNALQALGDSGTITLTTRREGDCVVVDVADDGPGIPEDVRSRIFDPFFTTKEVGSGTGLGLDVARRIVTDRHGGSLSVDSRPGETVFHVWLPIAQKRA